MTKVRGNVSSSSRKRSSLALRYCDDDKVDKAQVALTRLSYDDILEATGDEELAEEVRTIYWADYVTRVQSCHGALI